MKLTLLLILLLSVEAFSQQAATNERDLKRLRERAQAVLMVEQTAAEAPLWADKKSAVVSLADAADLSWKETPASARGWLIKARGIIDYLRPTILYTPIF